MKNFYEKMFNFLNFFVDPSDNLMIDCQIKIAWILEIMAWKKLEFGLNFMMPNSWEPCRRGISLEFDQKVGKYGQKSVIFSIVYW